MQVFKIIKFVFIFNIFITSCSDKIVVQRLGPDNDSNANNAPSYVLSFEETNDGSSSSLTTLTLDSYQDKSIYAILRDSESNAFTDLVSGNWYLKNGSTTLLSSANSDFALLNYDLFGDYSLEFQSENYSKVIDTIVTDSTYPDTTGLLALIKLEEDLMEDGSPHIEVISGKSGNLVTNNGNSSKKVTGVAGNAMTFDGSDDELIIPLSDARYDKPVNANFTLMTWVKVRTVQHGDPVLILHYGVNTAALGLAINSNRFALWDGTGYELISSGATIVTDQWYHVAVTIENGTSGILYVDGINVADSNALDNTPRDIIEVSIGGDNWGSFIHADIDEASYWSRALSETEIQTIFSNQTP